MVSVFNNVSFQTSKMVTKTYSTSFSIGVSCLSKEIRNAIYSIYGFVRFADEIADSFHSFDKEKLLDKFEKDYDEAVTEGISLNPVINAFQHTVNQYKIDDHLIRSFLKSMRTDLHKSNYQESDIKEYIYGSAEVVGLMCLRVFVNGNDKEYERLTPYACRLGAAFQKINFLRDLKQDMNELQRIYFPVLKDKPLDEESKNIILQEIMEDYRFAEKGIAELPPCAKLGVFTAFLYYKALAARIQKTKAAKLLITRIRINNFEKLLLFCKAYLFHKLFSYKTA